MKLGVFFAAHVFTMHMTYDAPRMELLRVAQQLEVFRDIGVCQVPLIFLLVQGSADVDRLDHLDHGSAVEMTRSILSMPQPIYGLALGETLIETRGERMERESATGPVSFNVFGRFELFNP